MGRVMLSALKSNSGKTVITCGLLYALKKRGLSVCSYKCGPDYIDPLFHKKIIDIPSENLDPNFQTKEQMMALLSLSEEKDMSVLEGAMGIYDGIAGTMKASAYEVSVSTDTPIILIMDVKGMGNTMISIIKGIMADDYAGRIKGLLLNNISGAYFEKVKPLIEEKAGIKVVGYLSRIKGLNIDSRHLGLRLPDEIADINKQLEAIAAAILKTVDIDEIMRISSLCGKVQKSLTDSDIKNEFTSISGLHNNTLPEIKLAVAKDEVFCFLYEDNLRLLREFGVCIEYFSPVHDEKIPKGSCGILLPGGYPELCLPKLQNNETMKDSIYAAINSGMPSLAECGGFMYLHEYITGSDGIDYKMAGVIKGKCHDTKKLCRFGYVNVSADGMNIKGHEFHYYDSSNNGDDLICKKEGSDISYRFGYKGKAHLWGFPHLYYRSCVWFIKEFTDKMREYQKNGK